MFYYNILSIPIKVALYFLISFIKKGLFETDIFGYNYFNIINTIKVYKSKNMNNIVEYYCI